MTGRTTYPVIRFIRSIASYGDDAEAPDRDLLARFAVHQDEDTFAVLVRRQEWTVFGVCARVLCDTPDAEDAFQAVMLGSPGQGGRATVGKPVHLARRAIVDPKNWTTR